MKPQTKVKSSRNGRGRYEAHIAPSALLSLPPTAELIRQHKNRKSIQRFVPMARRWFRAMLASLFLRRINSFLSIMVRAFEQWIVETAQRLTVPAICASIELNQPTDAQRLAHAAAALARRTATI